MTTAKNDFYNDEGYADPTAYKARRAVQTEEHEVTRRAERYVGMVKLLADLAGFDVISRIVVRDRKTGREFR